jgi:GNAT superfamily N-acetyltransferase
MIMSERFKLIAENLDTGPLLKKILAHEELWGQITDRQTFPGSPHKETETIFLRWARDRSVQGGFFDLTQEDHFDTIQALAPEVFDLIQAAITTIMGTVPQWDVNVGRVIVTRMKPGGVITEHTDEGPYADRYDRFHVCLQGVSCFVCGDDSRPMAPGQLWWFNHKLPHGVFYPETQPADRIHLIIDLVSPEYRAMRGLTFQRERAHELLEEARPLYEAHYDEIAFYKDIPLIVNEVEYMRLEETGVLRCYTARHNGDLVGYCVFRVGANVRYSTSIQANQDILYVDKSKRGALIGKRLIEYCHERLKQEGVQLVTQHSKVSPEVKALMAEMKDRKDVGRLFELLGYDLIDFVYATRLDQ